MNKAVFASQQTPVASRRAASLLLCAGIAPMVLRALNAPGAAPPPR